MNWEKINKLYSCGMQVVKFIGGRNIIFFGLFGTAVTTEYLFSHLVSCSIITLPKDPITDFIFSRESNPLRLFTSTLTDNQILK